MVVRRGVALFLCSSVSVILERFDFLTNLPQDLYSHLCTEECCELVIWGSIVDYAPVFFRCLAFEYFRGPARTQPASDTPAVISESIRIETNPAFQMRKEYADLVHLGGSRSVSSGTHIVSCASARFSYVRS